MKNADSENQELKVYVFYWSNTRLGVTDKTGTTHYDIQKRFIVATSQEEAEALLKANEKKHKREIRNQLKGHKTNIQIRKLIRNVFYKDGLSVREFAIKKGLSV